jgi:APA family basic amino acid/polyamine antiporter
MPGVPWLPAFSVACCLVLMLGLPLQTWLRFFAWLAVGLAVYWFFGRKHSTEA